MQLAETTMLLVKDEEALLAKVLGVFETYGAHGGVVGAPDSRHDTTLPGVPTGWALLPDVSCSPSLRTSSISTCRCWFRSRQPS